MQNFLAILEDLKDETETRRSRSWKWLHIWRKLKSKRHSDDDPEHEPLLAAGRHDSSTKDLPQMIMERQNSKHWNAMVLEEQAKRGFYRRTLRLIRILERDDSKSFVPAVHHF